MRVDQIYRYIERGNFDKYDLREFDCEPHLFMDYYRELIGKCLKCQKLEFLIKTLDYLQSILKDKTPDEREEYFYGIRSFIYDKDGDADEDDEYSRNITPEMKKEIDDFLEVLMPLSDRNPLDMDPETMNKYLGLGDDLSTDAGSTDGSSVCSGGAESGTGLVGIHDEFDS